MTTILRGLMSDNLMFLDGGGEMGALMRTHDWSSTPFGAPDTWPHSLRSTLSACLNSPMLGTILWGPELRMLYNDGYIPSLADHHPAALGQPVSSVWGDAWDQVSPAFHQAMKTGQGFSNTNVELPLFRNGRIEITFWDFTAAPIRGEDGSIVGLLNQGVETTEQVATLRALAQSEARLRELNETLEERIAERTAERDRMWDTSPDLMLVIDFEGVFRRVNPAWTALLGYTPEELVGYHVNEFVISDDHHDTTDAYEAAAGGERATVENRYRHKDGSIRHISWVAAPAQNMTYATGRDVTMAKKRAAELRRYREIVEATVTPICAFDTNHRLIAFNRAHNDEFRRVNGFESKLGDVFPDLFVAEQRPVMRALMDRALAGESFTEFKAFGRPELGTPSWEISYTPLLDDTGQVVGAFHQAKDISERLMAEADLERTQEALRQSQKMEAVGQLTGGLAHDFNNLLTGVMGNLELLQMRVAQGRFDSTERFIAAAQGAGRRAAALTQRLLAFSRRQTLDPKPTDVNRLITGMEDLIHRTMGPAISLEVVGAAGLWTASIDPSQLENALLNLCLNARDAMPDGGRLTIETANNWIDDRAGRERDLPAGQYLSLCVTDTGTGMTPETIERAFNPFFTTKPLGEGTGLGLSMIYGFARQSGGQVRIDSEVGRGTTMCVYLPRYIGDAEEPPVNSLETSASGIAGKTILVVDDEPTVRQLIEEVLTEQGYAIIDAVDGPAGLKLLKSTGRVDLLITDVGLPNGMNGRQVADAARELQPSLPVLFITGYAENAAIGNGLMEAGMELLTKPFSMGDLTRRVRAMLDA